MKSSTTSMSFDQLREMVLEKLQGLDARLTYHSVDHTIDVLTQVERIALEEGLTDEREIYLLKIAALYHDTGFLFTYSQHEEKSCEIFLKDAQNFDLNAEEIDKISELIMVTKIPQNPQNLMEKIICDADLDYLGRKDFPVIGDSLRREFLEFGIVTSNEEWENLQLKFLNQHQYHTNASIRQREPFKREHLRNLS
ncbi:MAG: HD domain-containing protein [Flavitalea sp.]